MPRYYALDAANAVLPEVATVVERLRGQRTDLVELRDAYQAREGEVLGGRVADDAGGAGDPPVERDDTTDPELRRLRLRMRGIVDQMQADAAWLDEQGIVLRDISTGLLDFPALVAGRPVWLCWRSGETEVGWWHRQDEGFAGRRPIEDLGSWAEAPRAN